MISVSHGDIKSIKNKRIQEISSQKEPIQNRISRLNYHLKMLVAKRDASIADVPSLSWSLEYERLQALQLMDIRNSLIDNIDALLFVKAYIDVSIEDVQNKRYDRGESLMDKIVVETNHENPAKDINRLMENMADDLGTSQAFLERDHDFLEELIRNLENEDLKEIDKNKLDLKDKKDPVMQLEYERNNFIKSINSNLEKLAAHDIIPNYKPYTSSTQSRMILKTMMKYGSKRNSVSDFITRPSSPSKVRSEQSIKVDQTPKLDASRLLSPNESEIKHSELAHKIRLLKKKYLIEPFGSYQSKNTPERLKKGRIVVSSMNTTPDRTMVNGSKENIESDVTTGKKKKMMNPKYDINEILKEVNMKRNPSNSKFGLSGKTSNDISINEHFVIGYEKDIKTEVKIDQDWMADGRNKKTKKDEEIKIKSIVIENELKKEDNKITVKSKETEVKEKAGNIQKLKVDQKNVTKLEEIKKVEKELKPSVPDKINENHEKIDTSSKNDNKKQPLIVKKNEVLIQSKPIVPNIKIDIDPINQDKKKEEKKIQHIVGNNQSNTNQKENNENKIKPKEDQNKKPPPIKEEIMKTPVSNNKEEKPVVEEDQKKKEDANNIRRKNYAELRPSTIIVTPIRTNQMAKAGDDMRREVQQEKKKEIKLKSIPLEGSYSNYILQENTSMEELLTPGEAMFLEMKESPRKRNFSRYGLNRYRERTEVNMQSNKDLSSERKKEGVLKVKGSRIYDDQNNKNFSQITSSILNIDEKVVEVSQGKFITSQKKVNNHRKLEDENMEYFDDENNITLKQSKQKNMNDRSPYMKKLRMNNLKGSIDINSTLIGRRGGEMRQSKFIKKLSTYNMADYENEETSKISVESSYSEDMASPGVDFKLGLENDRKTSHKKKSAEGFLLIGDSWHLNRINQEIEGDVYLEYDDARYFSELGIKISKLSSVDFFAHENRLVGLIATYIDEKGEKVVGQYQGNHKFKKDATITTVYIHADTVSIYVVYDRNKISMMKYVSYTEDIYTVSPVDMIDDNSVWIEMSIKSDETVTTVSSMYLDDEAVVIKYDITCY